MSLIIFLKISHLVGAVLGVGGATVSDVLFFKSIKDRKISRDELGLLKATSGVIWIGLAILFVTGLGMLISNYVYEGSAPSLIYSAKFLAKMTIVLVIFINGLVFHKIVFPFLKKNAGKNIQNKDFASKIWLLAATGTISIVSWYFSFILGALRKVDLSYITIIIIYLLLVLSGILFGYKMLSHKTSYKKRK